MQLSFAPFYPALVGICLLFANTGCNPAKPLPTLKDTANADSMLALKYGSDAMGMRKYVIAFLKSGPNRNQDSAAAAQIQQAHLANITRLADEGKLAVAGPFLDTGMYKGIYIFNTETVEEARILTESDPAIKAGRLIMELHPWYGSAALMGVYETHKKLQKKSNWR